MNPKHGEKTRYIKLPTLKNKRGKEITYIKP